jgi:hypothetical protein
MRWRCHGMWFTALTLSLACMYAEAQSSVAASPAPDVTHSDLPPSTIYAETLAPFEQTRSDMGNWSDIELAAFSTATATANAECQRLEQNPHEGEEALALARLCSVGMNWDGTYSAARWYTRRSAPSDEAPHLAIGFGLLLQADLNLQAVGRAIEDLAEVHDRLPLSADTDPIFRYTIDALEIVQPDHALEAALMRQPQLLEVVAGKSSGAPPLPLGVAEEEAWHTVSLLHLAHRTGDEEQAKLQLLGAVQQRTVVPSTTDLYLAQRGRKRYEWIDRPAPEPHVTRNTYSASHQKSAPERTELFVIECEDAADVPALGLAVDALRTRLPNGARATMLLLKLKNTAVPTKQPATRVVHALYTTDDLLEVFGFSSGPLFVIRDGEHKVKFLGAGTSAWLNPQRQAERLISSNLIDKEPPK